jgi:hypothetical protein
VSLGLLNLHNSSILLSTKMLFFAEISHYDMLNLIPVYENFLNFFLLCVFKGLLEGPILMVDQKNFFATC